MMVDLLNHALDIDREGISRLFAQSAMIDLRLAESPIEMVYTGDDKHAVLPILGIINGLMRVGHNSRIVTDMRNSYVIERFKLEHCRG